MFQGHGSRRETRRCRRTAAIIGCVLFARTFRASAACNAIPETWFDVPSDLGRVSTPFASPGQVVTVFAADEPFDEPPEQNVVTVTFAGTGSPVQATVLPAEADSRCPPTACTADHCSCLRFVFPDTDAAGGAPGDGLGFVGSATIEVRTGASLTARIGPLYDRVSGSPDATFPQFTALPPPNPFRNLIENGDTGTLQIATDGAGNLLIPISFSDVAIDLSKRFLPLVPFVEAEVPGLAALGDAEFSSYTIEGRRLSVTARRIGTSDHVLGTADGERLVLRIAGGGSRIPVPPAFAGGPIVAGPVRAWSDLDKVADFSSIRMGQRFVVYENPERGALLPKEKWRDINQDGDTTDHFLRAFDVTVPNAPTVLIDSIDEHDAGNTLDPFCVQVSILVGGPVTFPPGQIYAFTASDSLVEFAIPEACFDLNRNGSTDEVLHAGAFDLIASQRIPEADSSSDREVRGPLLAMSTEAQNLLVYDARTPERGAVTIRHPSGDPYVVDRTDGPLRQLWGFQPFGPAARSGRGFSVGRSRVAFLTPSASGKAVAGVYTPATDTTYELATEVLAGDLHLDERWLLAQVAAADGRSVVGMFDLDHPDIAPRLLCDVGIGTGLLVPDSNDELLGCIAARSTSDPGVLGRILENPATSVEQRLVHVVRPGPDGTGDEIYTGLAADSVLDVRLTARDAIVGVPEQSQCEDLNGDGVVGGGVLSGIWGTPYVVHTVVPDRGDVTNWTMESFLSREPALAVTGSFIGAIAPGNVLGNDLPLRDESVSILGRSLWDLDGDGHFNRAAQSQAVPHATGSCRDAGECSDGDPCTVDACEDGSCVSSLRRGVAGAECTLGALLRGSRCDAERSSAATVQRIRAAARNTLSRLPAKSCDSMTRRELSRSRRRLQATAAQARGAAASRACRKELLGRLRAALTSVSRLAPQR